MDVIDGMEYDECGIAVFIDKYLDVKLCSDSTATHAWCSEIRESAERRIAAGEPVKKGREILQMENHAK